MNRLLTCACLGVSVATLSLTACRRETTGPRAPSVSSQPAATQPTRPNQYLIGMIAKSNNNPVFQAARRGAVDAARDLGAKYGVRIEIMWRTPDKEDAQRQADNLEALVSMGVDGIIISCSDATRVQNAINAAVEKNVPVLCFDSDAAGSKRFCYHGVDDIECGRQVMAELARAMGGKGAVAILAGNQTAPNLQRRVQGVRQEMKRYPDIREVGVFYHVETGPDALAKVEQVQNAHPEITGWAMVGGWPLFTDKDLPWEPGRVKCVSVDALPQQLKFLQNGQVQVLLAQKVYDWGYRSVELMMDKLMFDKEPPGGRDISKLVRVTKDNMAEWRAKLKQWGLE